ncbi:MAG: response regulator [Planctomycetota bacterium]|jgi:two-component system chemotaxis response regulator CheY|nr:response regulator [Planctomycetota bacterium]
MTVLLVDDSLTMRRIQRNVLEEIGVESFVEAADGVEALAALRKNPGSFKLVLLDVNMPNKNGIETLKEVRGDSVLEEIPVIMVTSEAERSMIVEAIKSGANDYVIKPFEAKTIREKVGRFLDLE